MGKKVLVISSSPRKNGNSELLCDEFIRGAEEAGHKVTKEVLYNKKINYCIGCDVCQKTPHKCFQKDDMAALIKEMLAADIIVLATPVYFYSMSAQMKTFIDRTVPCYTRLSNKEFYFILTAADTNKAAMKRTVEGLRGFLDCLDNAEEKGILYGLGVWKKGEIKDSAVMEKAYKMGKSI